MGKLPEGERAWKVLDRRAAGLEAVSGRHADVFLACVARGDDFAVT
jgi:hypothetical protein